MNMTDPQQTDLVTEAREFLPEVTQERKSALCKAVTHKVVLAKAEWLIQQLCDEVERLRKQIKTMQRDARDDAQAAANEARWQERQGEDYGSY